MSINFIICTDKKKASKKTESEEKYEHLLGNDYSSIIHHQLKLIFFHSIKQFNYHGNLNFFLHSWLQV